MYVYHEEGVEASRAGVSDGCEPYVGAEKWTHVLCKSNNCS